MKGDADSKTEAKQQQGHFWAQEIFHSGPTKGTTARIWTAPAPIPALGGALPVNIAFTQSPK